MRDSVRTLVLVVLGVLIFATILFGQAVTTVGTVPDLKPGKGTKPSASGGEKRNYDLWSQLVAYWAFDGFALGAPQESQTYEPTEYKDFATLLPSLGTGLGRVTDGYRNEAVERDANATYYTVGTAQNYGLTQLTTDFSVSMWVRSNVASPTSTIIQANTTNEFYVWAIGGAGTLSASVYNASAARRDTPSHAMPAQGEWAHFIVEWDDAGGTLTMWKNCADPKSVSVTTPRTGAATKWNFLVSGTAGEVTLDEVGVWERKLGDGDRDALCRGIVYPFPDPKPEPAPIKKSECPCFDFQFIKKQIYKTIGPAQTMSWDCTAWGDVATGIEGSDLYVDAGPVIHVAGYHARDADKTAFQSFGMTIPGGEACTWIYNDPYTGTWVANTTTYTVGNEDAERTACQEVLVETGCPTPFSGNRKDWP